jgi:sec-independent protein translocase protein TatB
MGFGVGIQEMVIIGVIFLVLFGPSKLPEMARDIGKFVTQARRSIDEFKEELTAETEIREDKDKKEDKDDF